MKNFSNAMENCIEQASQLSYEEMTSIIHFLTELRKTREAEYLKEKIDNAIKTINALTEEFDYLETEDAKGIYLTDIIDGLEKLKDSLC